MVLSNLATTVVALRLLARDDAPPIKRDPVDVEPGVAVEGGPNSQL
jgi:hypothetical protein